MSGAEATATGRAAGRVDGTNGAPALSTRSLTMVFGGLRAVDGLDLDVPAGSIFGIMGPNGAGKTTVLNLVTGLLKPSAGTIRILGTEVAGARPDRIAALGVARTYQNVRLFPGLTVLETVVTGMHRHRRSTALGAVACLPSERRERRAAEERARELLRRVGVTARPEQLAETLAYGEQRRLEIARALASRPKLLVLDEPTAGMNPVESAAIGDLIRSLNGEGLTVLLIEHNIRLVLEYCTDAAVLDFGRLLVTGDPRTCVDDPRVREAYFGKESDADGQEPLGELRRDPGRP